MEQEKDLNNKERVKYRCNGCMNDFYETEGRYVNYKFYCSPCAATQPTLLLKKPVRDGSKIVMQEPLFTRDDFIEYVHMLLKGNVAKRTYSLAQQWYDKGNSWFDMARALEYFYVVKKEDISKANGSIGIIPYVFNDASLYYTSREEQQRRKLQTNLDRLLASSEPEVIKVQAPAKNRKRRGRMQELTFDLDQ